MTLTSRFQRPSTVAAAANLNFALTEIADQFARDRGSRVDVVFGASGTLARQILDGAPFEAFLAADEMFPSCSAAALTVSNAIMPPGEVDSNRITVNRLPGARVR